MQKAAAKDGKRTEWRIDGVRGLVLDVTPQGTATYRFMYHVRLGKVRKFRKVTIGRRDAVTLQEARTQAEELRTKVAAGGDPAAEQTARKTAQTFKELAEQRFTEDVNLAPGTILGYQTILTANVYPEIGDMPASDVTAGLIVGIMDKIQARGSRRQADHVKSAIGGVYKWGLKRRAVHHDPTKDLGKRAPLVARTNVLKDHEMKALWEAVASDKAPLSPQMRLIIQLTILTGQRRTEVAGARHSELSLEGDNPIWTIPGNTNQRGKVVRGRTKNGHDQVIPLSKQAAELFQAAIELSGDSEFVFPAVTGRVRIGQKPKTPHINGKSVSWAMGRLRLQFGLDDVTVHDMRRCIATWLGEDGVRPDVIDRILNHQPRDVTRRHYNFARMDGMVRRALQSWADHVEGLAVGRVADGKVVPFQKSAV